MKLNITKTYDNWLVLLQDLATDKVTLNFDQQDAIAEQAAEWPSCACGQLCQLLPRQDDGAPKDYTLYQLGIEFNDAVGAGYWDEALETFKKIEARSTKLVKNQQSNASKRSELVRRRKALDLEIENLR